MKKYQSIEAKRERIAELDELISGTEKGIRALEDYITRCDLAIAEGEEWDTEDTRRLLVKTYQVREEYRNERYTLIEELHDIATETAEALCTAYEETTNSPADYLAAYRVAREEVRGIRPATAEERETVVAMVEAIAERTHAAEAIEDAREAWEGEAYYRIAYSDGGQDYTNDGATWYETAADLVCDLRSAYESATDTHLPYAERIEREAYQRAELEAFLGEYAGAYDVDAIEDEATETDPKTGAQLWTPEAVRDLMSICERHELKD